MTSIFCVLRSGGEYTAHHVLRLRAQVMNHLPNADFRCLCDIGIRGVQTLPLTYDWPGWWSKMELFRPEFSGDILFMDLDTSIVGRLDDIVSVGRLALMRDIYRPEGLQSSIMYLPEAVRRPVWSEWISSPERWMEICRKGGDQAVLEHCWINAADRWQDILPGQIVSWKSQVRRALADDESGNGSTPDNARVVVFHGKPRPWEIGW
ncbi:hypothetical protein J5287_28455 (plasmid) [Rhizobium sp. K1/93]|nr:hypothetical protein [Rhizobium sp. L58/93]MBO9172197.1 hypothetical protein [Rhizobium sp. L245/93]MBO9187935.1 hypothetical protein [Rhizobium sp. E27B/91]QXZ87613.1 hypothetical protein J5287_28455 [Rhizobium sp. K1/93]QXZ93654.1 hypothetical protein J5280_28455 [Rhizobium sp. K15/93]QYA05149.1 hypothetical protein J5278_26325 [Rhizobium sp. B21/90]